MSKTAPRVAAPDMNTSGGGALARWRQELIDGKRGLPNHPFTWRLDDLWRAASKEMTALELEAVGDVAGARHYLNWALLCLYGCKEDPRTSRGRSLLLELRQRSGRPSTRAFRNLEPRMRAEWSVS